MGFFLIEKINVSLIAQQKRLRMPLNFYEWEFCARVFPKKIQKCVFLQIVSEGENMFFHSCKMANKQGVHSRMPSNAWVFIFFKNDNNSCMLSPNTFLTNTTRLSALTPLQWRTADFWVTFSLGREFTFTPTKIRTFLS